nr:hypothetical protein [Candidatus Sigynarchaeum springense]
MFSNNDEARSALFARFAGFQASFSAFLAAYTKEKDSSKRSAMATRFARDIAVPYLDSAKDELLRNVVPPVLAVDAELTKLLHVFGGEER